MAELEKIKDMNLKHLFYIVQFYISNVLSFAAARLHRVELLNNNHIIQYSFFTRAGADLQSVPFYSK
ncbi:hypothetical protein D1164_09380 [Mariniphaga sediminis]|uniref:Uncharacterized protein n=1 Tax=Mariniphaga sediminis TaxID=1628158 RepID=A0A399D3T7_9BACT|nr:hypothetical protein D1164_09380 [Mariniphaga sediminis]